jgi:hypothetical protein
MEREREKEMEMEMEREGERKRNDDIQKMFSWFKNQTEGLEIQLQYATLTTRLLNSIQLLLNS